MPAEEEIHKTFHRLTYFSKIVLIEKLDGETGDKDESASEYW